MVKDLWSKMCKFDILCMSHYKSQRVASLFKNIVLNLVKSGLLAKSANSTHTSVWITQDTTESRVP